MKTPLAIAWLFAGCLFFGCKKKNSDAPAEQHYTPAVTAKGTPKGAAVEKVIGITGGELQSADGALSIKVPAGAVNSDVVFSIQPINNTFDTSDIAYRLTPEGSTFSKPIAISYHYTAADMEGTMPELLVAAYQTEAGTWKSVPAMLDKSAQQFVFNTTHFSDWIVKEMMELKPEKTAINFGESVKLKVTGLALEDDLLAPLTPQEILEGLVKSFDWRLLNNSGSLTYNAQNECEATFTPDHPTGMSTSAEISVELDGNMKIRDDQAPGGFVIMKRMTLLTKITILGEVYMTGGFVNPINITDQVTALIANGHITINAHSAQVSIMLEAFGTEGGTYLAGQRGAPGNCSVVVTQNEEVPRPFVYSSQYTECGPPRVEKYAGTLTIEKWSTIGQPVQGSFSGSLRWLKDVVDGCPVYQTQSLSVKFRTVRGL